jgi:hypothetical protein
MREDTWVRFQEGLGEPTRWSIIVLEERVHRVHVKYYRALTCDCRLTTPRGSWLQSMRYRSDLFQQRPSTMSSTENPHFTTQTGKRARHLSLNMSSIPFRALQRLPRRINPLYIRRVFRRGLASLTLKGSRHILSRVLLDSRIPLSLS